MGLGGQTIGHMAAGWTEGDVLPLTDGFFVGMNTKPEGISAGSSE